MQVGKLDEAEAKARQAQRMNVVPPVTSDRAESVLHEIAMARAAKTQATPAATPSRRLRASASVVADARKRPAPAEASQRRAIQSVVAEREANELLAKGDQAAATAKFVEADRLSSAKSPGRLRPSRRHRAGRLR